MSVQERLRPPGLEAPRAYRRGERAGVIGPRAGRCAFLRQRTDTKRSVCRARASYRVGIELRERRDGVPVTVFVKLICCSCCARRLTKKDVLTKSGFRKMAAFAFEKQRVAAKWSHTRVVFDRL